MKAEAARRRENGLGGRPVRGWGGAARGGLIGENVMGLLAKVCFRPPGRLGKRPGLSCSGISVL